MTWEVRQGDCLEVMATLPENSVDAVVTDPPYLLGFMGKRWDQAGAFVERTSNRRAGSFEAEHGNHNAVDAVDAARTRGVENRRAQEWHQRWAEACLRVLKPGGHLIAFGGSRTYHRMACAVEDAGFEIRDQLQWLYGSGFPKSLDISKAIDKAAGAEREVVGSKLGQPGYSPTEGNQDHRTYGRGLGNTSDGVREAEVTAPATESAQRWQGWGTALKPAHEPIVLARKPLSERNVAANVERWGTGGLNVDGGRIGTDRMGGYEVSPGGMLQPSNQRESGYRPKWEREDRPFVANESIGRWPPNVALDEEAAAMVDEQSGELHGAGYAKPPGGWDSEGGWGFIGKGAYGGARVGDTGGASRFFYCAKADRAEREIGLGHLRSTRKGSNFGNDGPRPHTSTDYRYEASVANNHPTVKPIALMAWLCRLVTPPKGLILDPFCGSGSTGIAALREGFQFLGVERDESYCEIARARIVGDAPLFNMVKEEG